jgi:nucleotide-binding universal stress UspA family protein
MLQILVLTDFSNPAYEALFYISGLLKHQEARLTVLNTYTEQTPLNSPSYGAAAKSLDRQLEDEALEGLRQTVHRIRLDRDNPKHILLPKAVGMHLTDAALDLNRRENFDLIVMGNTGKSNRSGIFFGSNVLRVVKTIRDTAVLAVPESRGEMQLNEIALAADFNHSYTAELLDPLLLLARLSSAAIRVVHLNEEETLGSEQLGRLKKLQQALGNTANTIHWVPDFKKKADAIHSFIQEHGIAMLAMVNYQRSFLDELMDEPVIRKVSFMVEVPFLILPAVE